MKRSIVIALSVLTLGLLGCEEGGKQTFITIGTGGVISNVTLLQYETNGY